MDEIYLYRCDECGKIGAVGRGGGSLPNCGCTSDTYLRPVSRATATLTGDWTPANTSLARRTIDGPPALVWLQGTDTYALYVGGERKLILQGRDLPGVGLTALNSILEKGEVVK